MGFPAALRCQNKASPLMPGICTSAIRQDVIRSLFDLRNSSAEAKPLAMNPSERSRPVVASRTDSSSSTMAIEGLIVVMPHSVSGAKAILRLLLRDWQRVSEHGARWFACLDPYAAAMRFDDRPGDRQSEAHAAGFGRVECIENLLGPDRPKAGAGVAHADGDIARTVLGRIDGEKSACLGRVFHRLDRIENEVEHDLLHLYRVGPQRGEVVAQAGLQHDMMLADLAGGQRQNVADDVIDVASRFQRRRPLGQRAHTPNDLPRARGVLDDAFQRRFGFVEIGWVGRQPAQARVCVDHRAAIGWLTSWAIDAVNSPRAVTRAACASWARASETAFSAASILSVREVVAAMART